MEVSTLFNENVFSITLLVPSLPIKLDSVRSYRNLYKEFVGVYVSFEEIVLG